MSLPKAWTITDTRSDNAELDWHAIDTVLFDMDGTVLDLHFDNYFWEELVPQRYGQRHGLSQQDAAAHLRREYGSVKGTLAWYCLDFWSERLDMDIAGLKEQVRHKIALRPNAIRFVQALRKQGKKLMLVTNAHPGSLALKMRHTGIAAHFDHQISSHRFKLAKENPGFWQALRAHAPYDPDRTLLIDDSLPVLRQAQAEGIAHLRAIHQPDSQRDAVAGEPAFPQIRDFADIMTGPLRE